MVLHEGKGNFIIFYDWIYYVFYVFRFVHAYLIYDLAF